MSVTRVFSSLPRQPHLARLSAYATVLVAFLLRALRLGDKNIWWDEGWSMWLSQKDWGWIALRTAADEHPPLHYWMLHVWNTFAGSSAFAGRYLSVAFGVLTVALVYRLGKRVGGTVTTGVIAAFILATARFHIWWSQDIKNYTPSIFFAFAAVWFALDILSAAPPGITRGRTRALIAYALCAALALWTHYLAALVLLALNLYAAIVFLSRFKFPRSWLIANLIAALLFAPWMVLYLQNAATWSAAPAFDVGVFLKLVATVLPLGVTTNIDSYALLTIIFTALTALGIFASLRQRSPHATEGGASTYHLPLTINHLPLLFSLIVLLPPVLIYVFSLTPVSFFAPKVQARYLLILLPAYALLLALGIAALQRVSRYLAVAALAFVVLAGAFVLDDYYAGRRLTDDYATLANTINAFREPGDLVVLDTDQEWPTFLYYLRGAPDWLGVPNAAPMSAAGAGALVQRAQARHTAVWVMTNPDALATDPQRLFETRLARDLPVQFEQTFGDKRLVLYAPAPRDLVSVPAENFAPRYVRTGRLGEDMELLGFDLPVDEVRPGETLRLVTYWNARVPGVIAINGTDIRVPAGERVRVQADLAIPAAARDEYRVRIGSLELARVAVAPLGNLPAVVSISHPVDYRLGESIHLAGYDLPVTTFHPGDTVPLTLYWRAGRAVPASYVAFVHLVGAQFNPKQNNPLWGQVDHVPGSGAYPTSAWLPGVVVPDGYRVPVDPQAPPGRYQLEVGLYDPATGVRLSVDGAQDSIIVAAVDVN